MRMNSWTNEKSLDFISSINARPILWDVNFDLGKNSIARRNAWEDLAREFNITFDETQKKYKSLRTYYKYEEKKLQTKQKRTGGGPKESKWFAFKGMFPIMNQGAKKHTAKDKRKTSSFTPVPVENISLPQIQPRQPAIRQPVVRQPVVRQPPVRQPVVRQFAPRELTPRSPSPQLPPIKKVRSYIKPYSEIHSTPHQNTPPPNQNQSIYQDREVHICSSCPCIAAQENEYDKIGKAWASELQKMTSDQQIFAKRAIAEIIFEGQLGALHRQSVVINHVGQQMTTESSPSPFVVEKEEPDFDC